MDEKERLRDAEAMKRLAFFSISVSTVATLVAVVAVPSLYTYLMHIQSSLQASIRCNQSIHFFRSLQLEVDFCQHRTSGLFAEFSRFGVPLERRPKREVFHRSSGRSGIQAAAQARARGVDNYGVSSGGYTAGGGGGYDSGVNTYQKPPPPPPQCSCGVGPAGRPGMQGRDGTDGRDGQPAPGLMGEMGPQGVPGEPGLQGPKGEAGMLIEMPGIVGPMGSPGPMGAVGLPGLAGVDGKPGDIGQMGLPGLEGVPGDRGQDGYPGPTGGCDHCPTPRTAPGY
ncbi:Nematode cuticle collagen domain protein [Aphelenchoides fujianensis]|nr:Nematode cuticle collagen domain protein [Aphelenchoides fujianensis]